MQCPSCKVEIERDDAWICPGCNRVLNAAALVGDLGDLADEGSAPITNVDIDNASIEARIVDNISIDESFQGDEDIPQMLTGFDVNDDGHVAAVAYYSAGTSRVIMPDAVPTVTELADFTICTPYQEHILELVDGQSTVREISQNTELEPREVAIALLSLFDDGLIQLEGLEARPTGDIEPLAPEPPPVLNTQYLLELQVPPTEEPPPEIPRIAEPPPMAEPPPAEPEKPRVVRTATTPWGRKAEDLYEQALKDRDEGNLVSAQMNIKLALTFDKKNATFHKTLKKIEEEIKASGLGDAADREEQAKGFYKQATDKEELGDIDGAIELLEKAIAYSKQARFMNRLGVIIAMSQGDLEAGRKWIEDAIALSPRSQLYKKNLIKVDRAIERKKKKDKRKSLLGFFARDR